MGVLFTYTHVNTAARKKLTKRIKKFGGDTKYSSGGKKLCGAAVLVMGKGGEDSRKAERAASKQLPLITVAQLEERLDELEVGFLAGVGGGCNVPYTNSLSPTLTPTQPQRETKTPVLGKRKL